jgi:hypothetical protein
VYTSIFVEVTDDSYGTASFTFSAVARLSVQALLPHLRGNVTKALAAAAFSCLPFVLAASVQQPEPAKPPLDNSEHQQGVISRGDHAMGFSHQTTTHHFRLYQDGGAIEVLANDSKDAASREEIRMHLSHIVKLFSGGDFNVPMFIHDTTPPGAAAMSKLRQQIRYRYQEAERGGRIRISSANAEAVQAIHAFLRFQISDHQTGDSTEVSN